ncbi:MAG: hypothetical protein WCG66_09885 [bacterium]
MQKTTVVWDYGQSWLPQVEPTFLPGRVTIGLNDDRLMIRADLQDTDVMRDVFPFNFPAFTKCDAFEIFLGPTGEDAYYEFHVTPSNSVLQLFFDGTGEIKTLEKRMVSTPLFTSQTTITSEGWSVLAIIPLLGLFPGTNPEWLLSLGRYDHTNGQPEPVISSTSPHAVRNFHRKQEWRRIILATLHAFPNG